MNMTPDLLLLRSHRPGVANGLQQRRRCIADIGRSVDFYVNQLDF
jgi:hypothetical protein